MAERKHRRERVGVHAKSSVAALLAAAKERLRDPLAEEGDALQIVRVDGTTEAPEGFHRKRLEAQGAQGEPSLIARGRADAAARLRALDATLASRTADAISPRQPASPIDQALRASAGSFVSALAMADLSSLESYRDFIDRAPRTLHHVHVEKGKEAPKGPPTWLQLRLARRILDGLEGAYLAGNDEEVWSYVHDAREALFAERVAVMAILEGFLSKQRRIDGLRKRSTSHHEGRRARERVALRSEQGLISDAHNTIAKLRKVCEEFGEVSAETLLEQSRIRRSPIGLSTWLSLRTGAFGDALTGDERSRKATQGEARVRKAYEAALRRAKARGKGLPTP